MNDGLVVRPRAGMIIAPLALGAFFAVMGALLRARGLTAPWVMWVITAGCALFALLSGARRIEVGPRELGLCTLFGRRSARWADIERVELVRGGTHNGQTEYTLVIHVAGSNEELREPVAHVPREGLRRVLQAVASRAHRVELDHRAEALRAGEPGQFP